MLPLVTPFRSAAGACHERDVLLVRVVGEEATGWGECVAGAVPDYTSEHVDGAHVVMREHLVPRLLEVDRVAAPEVWGLLGAVRGHPMAKCALEQAVLDAELRARGVSLASYLGAERDRVPVGAAVGITEPVGALVEQVTALVAAGYSRVKLKIRPGWDAEPVRAVRDALGDSVVLQVDANCSYAGADPSALEALDDLGLAMIEQPFAADDLLGHAELARRLATPVCLDESITSSGTLEQALALGSCSVVNLKAGRVGGYLQARRLHDRCVEAGVPVWCGGMLETGVGRAASLALAALPGFTLPGDISASDRYWTRDITPPFELRDGCIDVPSGPGNGVDVDEALVEQLTTSSELIPRPDGPTTDAG